MTKWFYHGTTMDAYKLIQKDGFIRPMSGNTYQSKIFLSDNDMDARRMAFIKHAQQQGEMIVVFKIHRDALRRKLITNGEKHTAMSAGKVYCYSQPIDISHEKVFVAAVPFTLNLPEGVSIVRDGHKTGLSFTPKAAEKFGVKCQE
jgi:hypothetical protein